MEKRTAMVRDILLFVVVVGALFFYFKGKRTETRPPTQTASTTTTSSEVPTETKPAPEMVGADSVFHLLNDSMIFALSLAPQNLNGALDHLAHVKQNLQATQVWKKLQLDQMLDPEMLGMMASQSMPLPPGASMPPLDQETLNLILHFWSSLSEITFAVSSNTFSPDESSGIHLPTLHASVSFSDPQVSAKLLDLAKTAAAPTSPDGSPNMGLLKTVDAAKGKFEYAIPLQPGFKGALRFVGQQIHATFGATEISKFLSAGGAKGFMSTPLWQQIGAVALSSPVFVSVWDVEKFAPFMSVFEAMAFSQADPSGQQKGAAAKTGPYDDIVHVFAAAHLEHGLQAKSCTDVKPGSEAAVGYGKFLEAKAKDTEAQSALFDRLIGPKTIFAIRVPSRFPRYVLDQMKRASVQAPSTQGADADAWQHYLKSLGDIEAALDKVPFDELGVLVNVPEGMGFPEVGVYLGGTKEIKLSSLADAANGLFKKLSGGSSPFPDLKVAKDATGKEKIEISMEGQPPIGISSVSPNAILASSSLQLPALVAQAIAAPASKYVESIPVSDKSLLPRLKSSDLYFFLNIGTVFQAAKPFLPLLLMQQPNLQLGEADIDEVIKALEFGLLGVYETSGPKANQICGEAHVLAF